MTKAHPSKIEYQFLTQTVCVSTQSTGAGCFFAKGARVLFFARIDRDVVLWFPAAPVVKILLFRSPCVFYEKNIHLFRLGFLLTDPHFEDQNSSKTHQISKIVSYYAYAYRAYAGRRDYKARSTRARRKSLTTTLFFFFFRSSLLYLYSFSSRLVGMRGLQRRSARCLVFLFFLSFDFLTWKQKIKIKKVDHQLCPVMRIIEERVKSQQRVGGGK